MSSIQEKIEIKFRNDNKEIFAPLKEKWLIATPEEQVRQRFICYLVNEYGYNLNQMEQELQVSNSKRGQGRARADIVIWKSEQEREDRKTAFIVVECKAEKVTIRKEDYFQGSNYATWARAKFFITTNEKETKFFKVLEDRLPLDIDEIVDIPKAEDVNNETKINEILAQTKTFTKDEFQKSLFSCHDVIRNNDKLSPEMAFDEISKVLFMKILYERQKDSVFSKERFEQLKQSDRDIRGSQADYQHLFEQTKQEFKKDEIFEETDVLRIREASFLEIVKKLEKYNLSDISDDVKGIAFEEFLGKTFRGDLGQFFTPRTLVNFMISVLDPQEGEIIGDPCCGTGGFLIKAFEHIRENIEHDIQEAKTQFRNELIPENYDQLSEKKQKAIMAEINTLFAELNQDLEPNIADSRVNHLSSNCIYGTDAEPRSARTAKMNMIMHGDGHGGVHHHDGLLNINGIFENRFDVIVTNPPFGARVSGDLKISKADQFTDQQKINDYTKRYGDAYTQALKQVNDNIDKKLLSLYETGKMSSLTEVLFVERCLNLLRKGGRMGIVLPEGFLNGSDLQEIRDYIESRAKILLIVSIPQDVFMSAGSTVKSSLIFLKRFTEEEEKQYKQIKESITHEITPKYQPEIDKIQAKYRELEQQVSEINETLKATKKKLKTKDADTETLNAEIETLTEQLKNAKKDQREAEKERDQQQKEINSKIKTEVKNHFDYEFPIVQVEKAGIGTIGQVIDNELLDVQEEFMEYRTQYPIWQANAVQYNYRIAENGTLVKEKETVNF